MSKTDGIIRIIIALVVALLYYMGIIGGTLALVLGIVAVIFLITGFVNFCPLYAAFKIRTRSR